MNGYSEIWLCRGALGLLLWALIAPAAAAAPQASGNVSFSSTPNPDQGLALGGWMFYPSFFAGAVFNDNVYYSPSDRRAALGTRLRPSLEATLDNGLHRFHAFVGADAQIYPGLSNNPGFSGFNSSGLTNPSTIQARAGVDYAYRPLEDLTFNASTSFTRQIGLFATSFGSQAGWVFSPAALIVPTGLPQINNSLSATASVEKRFNERTFARLTGVFQGVFYDNPSGQSGVFAVASGFQAPGLVSLTQSNSQDYALSARGGFWVSPLANVFVESGGDIRHFGFPSGDVDGYRVVAGLATDQIGLVKGEAYGGYQWQRAVSGQFGAVSAPTLGGRLIYAPLAYLKIAASADYMLGAASLTAPTLGLGVLAPPFSTFNGIAALSSAKIFQARLQADYAFSPFWNAWVRGGYGLSRYESNQLGDTRAWTAGAGMSYFFWRNLQLTVEYQFSSSSTTSAAWPTGGFANYVQNLISAGVTYRY